MSNNFYLGTQKSIRNMWLRAKAINKGENKHQPYILAICKCPEAPERIVAAFS